MLRSKIFILICNADGNKPHTVVIVVKKIGLILLLADWMIAIVLFSSVFLIFRRVVLKFGDSRYSQLSIYVVLTRNSMFRSKMAKSGLPRQKT